MKLENSFLTGKFLNITQAFRKTTTYTGLTTISKPRLKGKNEKRKKKKHKITKIKIKSKKNQLKKNYFRTKMVKSNGKSKTQS